MYVFVSGFIEFGPLLIGGGWGKDCKVKCEVGLLLDGDVLFMYGQLGRRAKKCWILLVV